MVGSWHSLFINPTLHNHSGLVNLTSAWTWIPQLAMEWIKNDNWVIHQDLYNLVNAFPSSSSRSYIPLTEIYSSFHYKPFFLKVGTQLNCAVGSELLTWLKTQIGRWAEFYSWKAPFRAGKPRIQTHICRFNRLRLACLVNVWWSETGSSKTNLVRWWI